MSALCQLERELAHINAMISLLKTHSPPEPISPVMDPAYWRARIRDTTRQAALNRALQERIADLFAQLDEIQANQLVGCKDAPWRAMPGVEGI